MAFQCDYGTGERLDSARISGRRDGIGEGLRSKELGEARVLTYVGLSSPSTNRMSVVYTK